MENAVLTLGNLLTLAGVLAGAVGTVIAIVRIVRDLELKHMAMVTKLSAETAEKFDRIQKDATAARSKLYERLEAFQKENADTYVRADVQAVTIQQLLHSMEEHFRFLSAAAELPLPANVSPSPPRRRRVAVKK
jgi:hypothetical protein